MVRRVPPRSPSRAVFVGWALVLLVGTGYLPAVAPSSVSSPGTAAPAHSGILPFATRAGYSAVHVHASKGSLATRAMVPFDLVFRPRSGPPSAPSEGSSLGARASQLPGLSASEYAAIVGYFAGYGISIAHTWPDRESLSLVGSANSVDRAFNTSIESGFVDGRPVTFPGSPPTLPAWIEPEVAGVIGLESGFDSFSTALAPAPFDPLAPGPAAGPDIVTPGLARQFYGYSQLLNLSGGPRDATGKNIAVVLWGDGYAPSDITTFFANDYPTSTFPIPTVIPDPVDGAPMPSMNALSSPDPRTVEELTLDIEWAGSMAPGANVYAVYAPRGPPPTYGPGIVQLTDAVNAALSIPNVTAVSMSFGTPESSDQALASAWEPLFSNAAQKGITVLAATGDLGGNASANCGGGAAPQYPSSSPFVIAIGGTNMTFSRSILGQITGFNETAWVGGGGGYSTQFSAPSWQEVGTAAGPIGANGHRGMPDVSAASADDYVYFNGRSTSAAGTSFATPMWAGLVTDLDTKYGARLGFFTPRLYHVGASEPSGQIGAGLVDVTGGRNCVAAAVSGWDAATGWGTPRGGLFYEDLVGSFVNLSLAAAPSTIAPGASVAIVAHLTNRSTGRPIAGTAVDASLSSTTSIGPCTGTFETASSVTNSTGWVSLRLSVPLCYLGSHADVSVSVTTNQLYGTNGTTIAVNLLGLVPELGFLAQPPWSYLAFGGIMLIAVSVGGWVGRSRPPPPALTASVTTTPDDTSYEASDPSPPDAGSTDVTRSEVAQNLSEPGPDGPPADGANRNP